MTAEKQTPTKETWSRPLPVIDSDSQSYWQAAKEGYLGLPLCSNGHYFFYPRSICPICSSTKIELVRASGKGKIYSYTVVRRHPNPAFNAHVPYVVALIDLDEGPRMMSNVFNAPEEVKIGLPVQVEFEEISPEINLPVFKLA